MGTVSFSFNPGAEKRKRRQEAKELYFELIDRGAEPDTAERMTASWIQKGGALQAPEVQGKRLPPTGDPEFDADVPVRTTPEQLTLRKPESKAKKRELYGFDSGRGIWQKGPEVPEDTDVTVQRFNEAENNGYDIIVDETTGKEIRRIPNGRAFNRVIKNSNPSTPRTGAGSKDPVQVRLAEHTFKKYQDVMTRADREAILTPELIESARTAAEFLEVDFEEPELSQSFWDRIRKREPKRRNPVMRFTEKPDPKFDKAVAEARRAVQNKLIPPEEAVKRLRKAFPARDISGL
jgi:hypothetical protein